MITSAQMRAARALLGVDQKTLAELAGLSVPTIQRMEASSGNVRGVVDSLTKVIAALEFAGVELIGEGMTSTAVGRGVRLRSAPAKTRNLLTATATADDSRRSRRPLHQGAAHNEETDHRRRPELR